MESIDTRWVGSGSRTNSNQVYFRPALVYQELLPDHVAEGGLEFSLNFSTKINRARFPLHKYKADWTPTTDLATASEDMESKSKEILTQQTKVLPDCEGREDEAPLTNKIVSAATWGDFELVIKLLRSCYVTQSIANEALIAAARGGNEGTLQVVKILLQAGANADLSSDRMDGKTALLAAAQEGNEEIAALLISKMSKKAIFAQNGQGLTAFDLLRNMDLGSMARRLETLVDTGNAESAE